MSLVGLGITFGIVGSIAINTGNNVQSLGIHQLELELAGKMFSRSDNLGAVVLGLSDVAPGSFFKSKTWVIGTFIFVTGALLNFASYGFAPQSTLASLESIQFVTNLFLGKLLLKKPISMLMYLGTLFIVAGTVVTVTFSSKEGAEIENIRDLIELWDNWWWIGYLIFLVSVAMLLKLADWGVSKRKNNKLEDNDDDSDIAEFKTEEISEENIEAIIYAVFSALWGTLSVVFAKLLALLLELQAKDMNIFSHWFTYICIICWLVLMIYWLYRLNSALGQYNPLLIVPLLQANFIIFATISGGIYFQEFRYMSNTMWIGFTSGIVLMFAGIYLQIPPRDTSHDSCPEIYRPSWSEKEITDIACVTLSELKGFQSNVKSISVLFMGGTSRLNQTMFDRRTLTMLTESDFANMAEAGNERPEWEKKRRARSLEEKSKSPFFKNKRKIFELRSLSYKSNAPVDTKAKISLKENGNPGSGLKINADGGISMQSSVDSLMIPS